MKRCPSCNSTFDDNINACPFDNAPLTSATYDPLTGVVLDNRYRVIEKIGEGGMGKVYKAEHTVLGKLFALKVLNPELAQREDSVKRFINEAKITSKIGHPNIIEVTDFGRTPAGSFYFVMEFVNGKTLYDLLSERKTIPVKDTINIITQCADALYAAHQAGIVHRDLKPDNIILIPRGDGNYFVKVLDFGISKIQGEAKTRLTSSGVIIGTPEYMSPEQASQEETDHRTDIYSLGVIMYQMLTGNLPFYSTNPLTLLMMHKTKSPKPLKSFNPDIPSSLEGICLKCLSKRPEDRYQTMKELMDALNNLVQGKNSHQNVYTPIELTENTASNLTDIPPVDISQEKVEEVRSKLFADSNSVWFDPYSKPDEKDSQREREEKTQKPSSIIIDTGAAEEKLELATESKPHEEEIQLATEVPDRPRSPVPKVKQAVKTPSPSVKTPSVAKKSPFESILSNKNIIIIGASSLVLIAFILGIVIYKSTTSGLEENIKREIQFNTPLPVNPSSIQVQEARKENSSENRNENPVREENSGGEGKATKPQKVKAERSEKPQAEKAQTAKADTSRFNAYDYFKEANNYFKQGKYDMAAEYYKSAIRLKPDFAMAYRGLGACYAMLGKSELSIKQYEKYIELDPNGPDVDKVIQIINEYKSKKK